MHPYYPRFCAVQQKPHAQLQSATPIVYIYDKTNQPTNQNTQIHFTHILCSFGRKKNPNIFSFGTINWIDQQNGRLPFLRPHNNATAHRLKRHTTHIKCQAVTEYKFTHTLNTLLFIWYSRYKTHKNRRTHKHWTWKRKQKKTLKCLNIP